MTHGARLSVVQPEPLATDLVPRLEALLEAAKSGEISAFAAAVVYRNGYTGDAYSYLPHTAIMLGAIEKLKFKIMERQE